MTTEHHFKCRVYLIDNLCLPYLGKYDLANYVLVPSNAYATAESSISAAEKIFDLLQSAPKEFFDFPYRSVSVGDIIGVDTPDGEIFYRVEPVGMSCVSDFKVV